MKARAIVQQAPIAGFFSLAEIAFIIKAIQLQTEN